MASLHVQYQPGLASSARAPWLAEPAVRSSTATRRKPFSARKLGRQATGAPEVALLVSTYQKPAHLACVLQSIALQRGAAGLFEVAVTDDGSTDETHRIVEDFAASVSFPVTLTSHQHVGFQLARCRNEGTAASTAPYLLFLDGDCVLPPDHVAMHLKHRRPGRAMCGYCIRLDRDTSARFDEAAIASGEYAHWPSRRHMRDIRRRDRKARFYRLIRHPEKPKLTGGNCGIWRKDFERINGFDESFEGWGGEDTDFGLRLRRAGIPIESILRWTHTYHLWHPPDSSAPRRIRDGVNQPYFHRKLRLTKCVNGLVTRRLDDICVVPVGCPNQPEKSKALLRSCKRTLLAGDHGGSRRHPDVEVLVLPGKGNFTGQADCRVLVVLEDCHCARRLASKADVVVADQSYRDVPDEYSFKLNDFRGALSSIAGQ